MSWQTEGRAARSPRREAPRPGGGAGTGPGDRAPAPALLPIAEVRARTGLSARTLRYYEELGLLPGVRRRAGGRRVYGPDELERLRFIGRLKQLGLPLAEIKELAAVYALAGSTRAMLERLDVLLAGHAAALEARIAELDGLRGEIARYRGRVARRIEGLAADKPEGGPGRPPRPGGRTGRRRPKESR